jgi:glycerol-3-phosphate dehydrogenase
MMAKAPFSIFQRSSIAGELQTHAYDLLVIGGGITGAGIALDAASRGLSVALVEQNDFAFGTSSRSTKLIHGGLRYLKQFEFGLVKEVGSERAVVHRLAPHLVIPEKMLLPLSDKKGMGYWLTSIGLGVYDFLAGVKDEDKRRMLTKSQTLKYEPLLKPDDVNGGAIYAEYRTDDARLTIEIIKAAVQHGATILNYAKVTDFVYQNTHLQKAVVHEQLSGEQIVIEATVIVNASGPWVDTLREIDKSKVGKRLHLTKGVHIVVAHIKFPVKQAIYFDVDDGRMIFAIPRGRATYIGTTDTNYKGDLHHVTATRHDAEYLLQTVNAIFPSVKLHLADVESSWAGLRPLIHEEGKSASELSRKDEIFESPSGLISIAGGKLTGYRKMAERVVNMVIKKHFLHKNGKRCYTDKIYLPGSGFLNYEAVKAYVNTLHQKLSPYQLPESVARYLVANYGKQSEIIIDNLQKIAQNENAAAEIMVLKAELHFTVHYEMTTSLIDFFVRRTGLLYFDIAKVIRWKVEIGHELKRLLGWSEPTLEAELSTLNKLIQEVTAFTND